MEKVTTEQVMNKLIQLRNDLWKIYKTEDKGISIMQLELKNRKPFLDLFKNIEQINNILEENNIDYNFKVISKEEFENMTEEERDIYIKELENDPERFRMKVYSGKNKQNEATYRYGNDGFTCPHCNNDDLYKRNGNSIIINHYNTPKDEYTDWHEDKFCKHCGGRYTIINGV